VQSTGLADQINRAAGIKLEHVPYRGGGQAINDLVAGHVKIGSLGSSPLIPHYKAGTLRLLAQTTAARSPSLTYQEAGIGLVMAQWLGVFVPKRHARADRGAAQCGDQQDARGPGIRENFLLAAQEPVGGSAEQFGRLSREDGWSKTQNMKLN
jgi:tripartite-type tricarboxylate transporter receptor subunit TctC